MNNMITTINRMNRCTSDSNHVTYHNIKQLKTKENDMTLHEMNQGKMILKDFKRTRMKCTTKSWKAERLNEYLRYTNV